MNQPSLVSLLSLESLKTPQIEHKNLGGPINADLFAQVVATAFQNTPKLGCFLAQVRVLLEELS
jgi:hypothetical protein